MPRTRARPPSSSASCAQSRLDVDGMFAENASDLVCVFPTAPGGPQEVRGWETDRAFYSAVIRPMWITFALTRSAVHPLADDAGRVVAEFASEGMLVDGSPYRNTYLCLATVRDGLIRHWTAFSDPAPIARGLAALQRQTLSAEQAERSAARGEEAAEMA